MKSIYLDPSVLVVDLYQTHWNEITELVDIALVSITSISCLRFTSGNYLLKPYKWNKENAIITFWSYVRITSESYVRLKLGTYVIKPCKWSQKVT